MTDLQKVQLLEFLWDYMKCDPEHSDRVRTGWGTKTKAGLCACIERITQNNPYLRQEAPSGADATRNVPREGGEL